MTYTTDETNATDSDAGETQLELPETILEVAGQKVLFDEKVSLFPVKLVAEDDGAAK